MSCTMIDSLAFLPLDKVREGMAYLKQNTYTDAEDILCYFGRYYVNGTFRRIDSHEGTVRIRKLEPTFPLDT